MHPPSTSKAVAVLAGVAALVVLLPAPKPVTAAGGIALFVLPGYALAAAVVPTRRRVDRVLAALVLAIATVVIGSVVLDAASVPLRKATWVGLALVVVGLARYASRARVEPAGDRPANRLHLARREVLLLGAAAAVAASAVAFARHPLPPPDTVRGYTQLWLVPSGHGVHLGVASYELHRTRYRVELVEGGRASRTWHVDLRSSERWEVELPVSESTVEARLYLADRPSSIYRRVWLSPASTVPRRR
jgi:uncharacterized membrane protein